MTPPPADSRCATRCYRSDDPRGDGPKPTHRRARRLAVPLALTLLAVLAGCATAPDGETPTPAGNETFTVEMTGDPTQTYVVAARLVTDPFENVTVTYANGSTRRIAVPDRQGAVAFGPESNVTDVEPGAEAVGVVHFEGSPNFTVTDRDVPSTGNVVYTVREKREGGGEPNATVLTAWGLIRCDGHVTELSLRVGESGVKGARFGCES